MPEQIELPALPGIVRARRQLRRHMNETPFARSGAHVPSDVLRRALAREPPFDLDAATAG